MGFLLGCSHKDRRRSRRIQEDISIQLVGKQQGSAESVEQMAQTVDVSDHGALVQARSGYEPGSEVMIHNPKNLKNRLFRVIWSKPSPTGNFWNIAVEYQDRDAIHSWGFH